MACMDDYEIVEVAQPAPATVVVSPRLREKVLAAGFADPEAALKRSSIEFWTSGGRIPHPVVRLGEDLWVVKAYRRGGFFSRWNRSFYWSGRRFLREIAVCNQALRAGVPTVPPVALILRRHRCRLLRAWLITPYVANAVPLSRLFSASAWLAGAAHGVSKSAVFRAAGETVCRMHGAGIDHHDLNVNNLMACSAGAAAPLQVIVLDWDRACLRLRPGGFAYRNLLRLYRSCLKMRVGLAQLAAPARSFLRGYFRGNLTGLDELRRYYRRWKFTGIELHRFFWRGDEAGKEI